LPPQGTCRPDGDQPVDTRESEGRQVGTEVDPVRRPVVLVPEQQHDIPAQDFGIAERVMHNPSFKPGEIREEETCPPDDTEHDDRNLPVFDRYSPGMMVWFSIGTVRGQGITLVNDAHL